MEVGQRVGNYTVVRLLGEGGMGQVWTARHDEIERWVAIKTLRPGIATATDAVRRFRGEAQAVNAIGHANIVQIYDFGTLLDGTHYFVMELLRGETLKERIARGPLTPDETLPIARQTAAALGAAHEHGFVHRDVKPDNLFLVDGGSAVSVKVLDFGVAKTLGTVSLGSQTQAGTLIGTPLYMAPEQWNGKTVGPPTDVYSLGCVLFEMLAGRPPFIPATMAELVLCHLNEAPPRLGDLRAGLPAPLEAVLARCLEKDPARRFSQMSELARSFQSAIVDEVAGRLKTIAALPQEAREPELRALAREFPDEPRAARKLAEILRHNRNAAEACAVLERAVARTPGDAGLRYDLGNVLHGLRRLSEAAACLRGALDSGLEPGLRKTAEILLRSIENTQTAGGS